MNLLPGLILIVFIALSPALHAQVTENQTESAYGLGKRKLPPPKSGACASEQELNQALAEARCDCSCEGYAKGPERACQVVCGLPYYACWAPDPTDAEALASFDALFEGLDAATRAPLEEQMKSELRTKPQAMRDQKGLMMMQRAAAWDEAHRCTE